MEKRAPIYLHLLRKQWGFSKSELALLLGIAPSTLGDIEARKSLPSAAVWISVERIFGLGSANIFPRFGESVESDLARRAGILLQRLADKEGRAAQEKRMLLLQLVEQVVRHDT